MKKSEEINNLILEAQKKGDYSGAEDLWVAMKVQVKKEILEDIKIKKNSFFQNIDWAKLRDDKEKLISLMILQPSVDLDGIINLIDAIQDHVVDVLGIPEDRVFNLMKD